MTTFTLASAYVGELEGCLVGRVDLDHLGVALNIG